MKTLLSGTPNEHLLQEIPEDGPTPVIGTGIKGAKGEVVGGIIGETEVLQGRTLSEPPLVRHYKTKKRYKGSGRYGPPPEHVRDLGLPPTLLQQVALERTSKNYRETASYREAFEALLPANADIAERGSLAWWFDQAWEAAEGSPQVIECPHPELHTSGASHGAKPLKHIVAFKKEANLIFKMIELAVGKAQQTTNININEKKLVESLEYRVIDVRLQSIDDAEVSDRIKMISELGYIEGEIIEVPKGTHVESQVPGEPVSA
jgi:hypothetical protein